MNRIWKRCVTVVFGMLVFTSVSSAGIRPSFHLDSTTWDATEIAIVSEGDVIDGRLTVIESLKGDLKKGEVIVVPALEKCADEAWRTTGCALSGGHGFTWSHDGKPVVMSGQRMIVFLRRPPEDMEEAVLARQDQTTIIGRAGQLWIAAGSGPMRVSTLWIEAGKTYSFQQMMNPGPSTLTQLRWDEKETLARIKKLGMAQKDLNRIEKIEDKPEAAKQAAAYLGYDSPVPVWQAITILTDAGQASMPVLLQVLDDPKRIRGHSTAMHIMACIGGDDVDKKLVEVLKQDITFWRKLGPTLKRDWWQGVGLDPTTARLYSNQYCRTMSCISALQKRAVSQARQPLDELRRFWRSVPLLGHPKTGRRRRLSEACDYAIEAIDKKAKP
jgi:hypothetical protein